MFQQKNRFARWLIMNKHILIVSQYYFPENFRINDIAKEWVNRGYKVTVITGIPNYPKGKFYKGYGYFRKRKEIIDGVNIKRLAIFPRFNNSLFLALNYVSFVISGWFWAKFTNIKADLVFNFEVSPMTQALPAIWYAKRKSIPSFIYVQDLWPDNLQIVGGIKNKFVIKRVNKMVDIIYTKATKILVTSNSFRQTIVDRGVDENKVVLWSQYAEDFYKPLKTKYRSKNDDLRIIFTGNIGDAQGLDILPKIANELKNRGLSQRIKFVLVGDGRSKERLVKLIQNNELSEMFDFLDPIPSQDIPELLSKSDVAFLSFDNNELFSKTIPAKLQSYMACGMPILAIATGESKRIVMESECGFVSEPGDVYLAVSNIIKILELDKEIFENMSKNSFKYYKKEFNKSHLMNEMDLLIKEHI